MKTERTLKERREKSFELFKDRINSLKLQDEFVINQWVNQLYKRLEKQDKEFIKEVLEEGIPQSIERGQFNERYFKTWIKQKIGFEE